MTWKPIEDAPKKSEPLVEGGCDFTGPWILARDRFKEARVIRWTTEYPCDRGVWMYAYAPTDYIDNILEFNPVEWMEIPE